MVIIPCRGVDVGLERNLRSLFRQDYGNFRLRFVVGAADDPACAVIRRLMNLFSEVQCEILVAGRGELVGQKVHKLQWATADLPPEIEFLAFADSDARMRRQWLRALVARVDREGVGAVTGYRWFIPVRPTLANHLLYSINSHVAVLFGSAGPEVIWGGSWAIRRAVFESLNLRQIWEGTLSDDLVATRRVIDAGLRVIFEPACMVLSPADVSMKGLIEFVRRQYLMGRFYASRGWLVALAVAVFGHGIVLGNLGLLAYSLANGRFSAWIPGGVLAAMGFFSVLAGLLRQDLTLSYFAHLHTRLRHARRFELWGGPLVALTNALILISSTVGRQIRWRGTVYQVDRGGCVRGVQHLENKSRSMDVPTTMATATTRPPSLVLLREPREVAPSNRKRRCA